MSTLKHVLLIVGLASFPCGAELIYVPAGWIVLGVVAIYLARLINGARHLSTREQELQDAPRSRGLFPVLENILLIGGLASFPCGAWLIYAPAGWIVFGVTAIHLARTIDRAQFPEVEERPNILTRAVGRLKRMAGREKGRS